jgi:hypothetical protein
MKRYKLKMSLPASLKMSLNSPLREKKRRKNISIQIPISSSPKQVLIK